MAKKGDLNPVRHINIGIDEEMARALDASALRNERRLAEECRFAVRVYLGLHQTPAEAPVDV